jgi:predicted secreted protein
MFDDHRSKRVLLVAHCVLNQNAKIDRCAHYPGVIRETVEVLIESGVGLIQMPCPELCCLGLDRQVDRGASTTIETEDTRVAKRMVDDKCRARCQSLVDDLVYQVEEYRKNGFEMVGLLGINGSPTCGVETTWANDGAEQGPGIFIRLLNEVCCEKGGTLRQRGITAREPQKAVAAVRELIARP